MISLATRKHFTLSDRINIERYLDNAYSFKNIGRELNRDSTTIAKEVKKHISQKKPADTEGHSITAFTGLIASIHTSVTALPVKTAIAGFVPDAPPYVGISRKKNAPSVPSRLTCAMGAEI
jgi:Transposase and inactivated derivatives, IS30 family